MKNNPIMKILIGLTVTLVLVSGVRLLILLQEYAQAQGIYDQLSDTVVDDDSDNRESSMTTAAELGISVDFAALKKINLDILGWLYIPDTNINYPITKSADNRDYLKIASTGERSVAGSIFMDYRNTADFSDRNTIIYGHNMKNGSMFGTLDAYEDKKYWEDHPKIYIFTETTTYVYEIYTAAEISANVDYYKVKLVDDQAYANYLTATVGNALYETGVIPTIEQKILTLSTCTTNHKNRFVIQGVLLEEG